MAKCAAMFRTPLQAIAVCSFLSLFAACRPAGSTCVPGRSEACTCATGSAGMQTCNSAGDGFAECQCAGATCATAGASRCGAHGACQDAMTGPTCTCAAGYAGADCSACARGFQDNDSDGTCTASCATAASCGAHGACTDVSGTATCDCDDGYTGAACAACAAGFQDADGNGSCKPTCTTAMLGCGLGGTCDDSTGTATCVCASNTTGATCASCAAGFQDNDGNNTCEPACITTSCTMHGTCSDSTGRVVCTCNAGFGGATCNGCLAGFQDNDNNGTCLPSCATAGLTCDSRSACDDRTGNAACLCVAGFSAGQLPDGGFGCLFTGGLADPGFQGMPANAWTTPADGGWTLNPDAGGLADANSDDAGMATLPAALRRSLDAQLSQTFVLAGADTRQGLRLNMLYSSNCSFGCMSEPPMLLQLNDTFTKIAPPSSWPTVATACVGEGALGPMTTLTLSGNPHGQATPATLGLDRLWFTPDDTCPSPGQVFNGHFDTSSTAGWTLTGPATSILAAAGVNGSGALRLLRPTRCDAASAQTNISVPVATKLPKAALRLKVRGTQGRWLSVRLDGYDFELDTALTPGERIVCLPDTMKGRAVPLLLQLTNAGSGLCSDVDNRFVELDDLEVVSEPSCPASLRFGEGGFESGASSPGWFVQHFPCSATTCSAGNAAGVITDPAQARTGGGAGFVSAQQRCVFTQLKTPAVVPASNATGGPALRFFYRLPSLNMTQGGAAATVTVDGVPTNLAISPTWAPQIICLAGGRPGRPADITFEVRGTYGACAEIYPTPDVLFIDDLLVTNDPACP